MSFVAAIAAGALVLLLSFCTVGGGISFIDALFRSTSAICVTGLVVQDTPSYFTPAGQVVILILFQLGGLGIMTFSTLILLVAGRRISFKDRLIIQEGFNYSAPRDVHSLIKSIFLYTFTLEFAGAALLFLRWRQDYPPGKAAFLAVFHSVSAFCNAGFALFSDSFAQFRGDILINTTLIILIVLGGIGFLVLRETREALVNLLRRRRAQFSLHAKLVLSVSLFLILLGFVIFLSIEWDGSLQGMTLREKIVSSLFQVITPRTAGFNTLDMSAISYEAVSLLIMLMFIGASPGSTGGGVKTSTFGVIFAFLRSKLAARDAVNLYHRSLSLGQVTKAYTVVTLGICIISLSIFILFLSHPAASMKEVLFEVFSAFGTVGLSLGLTPKLNALGKIVIIVTMYIGRIGPLTLLYAFSREKSRGRFEYAEETVMIG